MDAHPNFYEFGWQTLIVLKFPWNIHGEGERQRKKENKTEMEKKS